MAGDPKKNPSPAPDAPCKEMSAVTDKKHKACVKADPALIVKLRTAFIIPPSANERFSPGEGIPHATFEIDGNAIPKVETKVTKAGGDLLAGKEVGLAKLPAAAWKDGERKLRITHPANRTSLSAAGPDTKDTNQRLYRALEITLQWEGGKLKGAKLAPVNYASVIGYSEKELAIDLKPDWIRFHTNRKRKKDIELIVLHHTGGEVIGPAINQVSATNIGPHYEIDKDGHIIKFVEDDQIANHAHPGQWAGQDHINEFSIGIEVVHEKGEFTDEQYKALVPLLQKLVQAHGITSNQIVSHCDVVMDHEGLRHRPEDPGLEFDWTKLESESLSMALGAAPAVKDIYEGFFAKGKPLSPPFDKESKKVVEELGDDLQSIGYYVKNPADFDSIKPAIYQFYQHFFAHGRPHSQPKKFAVDGKAVYVLADADFAVRVKQVVSVLEEAAEEPD